MSLSISGSHDWIHVADALPAADVVVDTKIDNEHGCRNEQPLKRVGGLWFFPDNSMYVYYTPTHWRWQKQERPERMPDPSAHLGAME